MWIIFYDNKPCFWLVGGELYRAGRQDCHVIIQNDPTISRTHLSFEVGLTPLQYVDGSGDNHEVSFPAALTLIDSSTYGSVVRPGANHPRSSGEGMTTSAVALSFPPSVGAEMQPPSPPRETGIVGLRYTERRMAAAASSSARAKRGRDEQIGSTANTVGESEVEVVGEHHELVKGTLFRVPVTHPEWQEFSVVLGRRGATLTFLWVEIRVLVRDVDRDLHTKLGHHLSRCGVRIACATAEDGTTQDAEGTGVTAAPAQNEERQRSPANQQEADFLVTEVVRPTPETLSMLLRGSPVVRPAYFDAIIRRPSPQAPLPDPQAYLPKVDEDAWEAALAGGENAATTAGRQDWGAYFTPKQLRSKLFAGLTFVVFQPGLFHSVSQFVTSGRGRVLWDESLHGVVNERTRRDILDSFSVRCQRHVVLYSEEEPMPFRGCLAALREGLQLCCIPQHCLIKAVLDTEPLLLPPFPNDAAVAATGGERLSTAASEATRRTTSAAAVGRKTDATPVFPSLNCPNRGGGLEERELQGLAAGRVVSESGWTSWEPLRDTSRGEQGKDDEDAESPRKSRRTGCTSAKPHRRSSGAAPAAELPEFNLPSYPCFENASTAPAPSVEASGVVNLKTFRKQPPRHRATSPPAVARGGLFELDWGAHAREMAADLLSSRVPGIDADTLLPERADLVGAGLRYGGGGPTLVATVGLVSGGASSGGFNAFDTAAHHAVQRKKAAKAPAAVKGRGKAAAGAGLSVTRASSLAPASAAAVGLSSGKRAGIEGGRQQYRPRDESPEEVESPPDVADNTGSGVGAGGQDVFNIFAIEGIF